MALSGTFAMVYGGADATGVGIGTFVVTDGRLVGKDFAGCRYEGVVIEQGDRLDITLDQHVPAGIDLITGVGAQDVPMMRRHKGNVPRDFGGGAPIELQSDTGKVTVMIKPIAEDRLVWLRYAIPALA